MLNMNIMQVLSIEITLLILFCLDKSNMQRLIYPINATERIYLLTNLQSPLSIELTFLQILFQYNRRINT